MAKYYGDIPCVKLYGIVHITKCATECLCGQKWSYKFMAKSPQACLWDESLFFSLAFYKINWNISAGGRDW